VNESEERSLWITGAGGLIGSHLAELARRRPDGRHIHGWTRAGLDLRDHGAIRAAFLRTKPTLILHCAAVAKIAACEADRPLARQVNVEATRLLCEIAGETPVWFLSTDLVFDGKTGGYDESSAVRPMTFYGETKVEAERHVLARPHNAVFRLSLNGGRSPTRDRGFNEEFRRAIDSGQPVKLYADEFRCPAAASMTAGILLKLATSSAFPHGLFHLCGGVRMSRFEIGRLLLRLWGLDEHTVQPGSIRDHAGPPRAPDTSMTCAKLETFIGERLPGLEKWLLNHPEQPF
jgi:dTDP-4-dehydrorhamnose reductase